MTGLPTVFDPALKTRLEWLVPLVPAIAAVVLGVLLVRGCNRAGRAESELARVQEQLQLERDGYEVVDPVPDVRPRVDQLEHENEDLRVALEKARRGAPGSTPVGAGHASTGSLPAGGTPREGGPRPCALAPDPRSANGGGAESTSGSSLRGGGSAQTCLLAPHDTAEITVDQVVLQTKAGNRVLVGAAAAWRLSPEPKTKLFSGPFQAPLTDAVVQTSPSEDAPGWGAGPILALSDRGTSAGVIVSTPSARVPLLGWHVEAVAAGTAGAGGWNAQTGLVFRP